MHAIKTHAQQQGKWNNPAAVWSMSGVPYYRLDDPTCRPTSGPSIIVIDTTISFARITQTIHDAQMTVISGEAAAVASKPNAVTIATAGAVAGLPTPLAEEEEEEERLLNAEAIGREEETVHDASSAAALPPLAHLAADTCAIAMAESFLLAQKGLHTVKEIDAKAGVSRRLQPAAERLSIKAHEIDDQLRIREGLRDAADRATASAAVLSGRAMELSGQLMRQSPALAQGAQKTSKMVRAWVGVCAWCLGREMGTEG